MNQAHDNLKKRDQPLEPSLNRILTEIVGPGLIMLMVGALVFFLIEVFYRGPHTQRLQWVLGLFTFATVLVSRISIEEGLERASLFGFGLAAATLFVTVTLVDFEYGGLAILEPVVVIAMILVVMWSANRLTWDCTVIDDSRDVSSIGLSEFVKRQLFRRTEKSSHSADDGNNQAEPEPDASAKPVAGYQKFLFLLFANSKTQNTPGLWVFYFALAAFPIFGFGQWFAQPSSSWGYRWIFFLFAIYLGSALALLMLTSLFGLERYLKKRGATMPASIAHSWLTVGAGFAAAVMIIMLLLPSPSLSNGLTNALGFLTSNNPNTSQHAFGDDGQNEGDQPRGQKLENEKGEQQPGQQGAGDQGDGGSGQAGKSKGKASGKQSQGKQSSQQSGKKSGSEKGGEKGANKDAKKGSEKDAQQGKSSSGKKPPQRGEKSESGKQSGERDSQDKNQSEAESNPENGQQADRARREQEQRAAKNQDKNLRNRNQSNPSNAAKQPPNQAQQPPSSSPSGLGKFLAGAIRFLIYGVGLLVLLVVIWMFRDELAKLWNDLFGKKQQPDAGPTEPVKKRALQKPSVDFAQFNDPFTSGAANTWSTQEVIEYTFAALESWGRGHGISRDEDETPHEFARRLSVGNVEIASYAKCLADLYGQSTYGGQPVDRSELSPLRPLWQHLEAHSPLRETQPVGHVS